MFNGICVVLCFRFFRLFCGFFPFFICFRVSVRIFSVTGWVVFSLLRRKFMCSICLLVSHASVPLFARMPGCSRMLVVLLILWSCVPPMCISGSVFSLWFVRLYLKCSCLIRLNVLFTEGLGFGVLFSGRLEFPFLNLVSKET